MRRSRKDKISFDIVAKNGNNVEATFDTVERIVQLVAFDDVAGVDGALVKRKTAAIKRQSNRV